MSIIVEKKIETAWKAAMSADTYITTNAIPVYGYRDVSHVRPQKCVVVKVGQCENIASPGAVPSSGLYSATVEILAVSFTPDDKTRATLEAIYQAICGVATTQTIANMTSYAVSGCKFISWSMEKGNETVEEDVQVLSVVLECNVQIT